MPEPDDDHGDVICGKLGECVVEQLLRHRLRILHVPHQFDRFLIFTYVPKLCVWHPSKLSQGDNGGRRKGGKTHSITSDNQKLVHIA